MNENDVLALLSAPLEEIRERAAAVLEREKGSHVFLRGLVEFSNVCRRNCLYCGLRSANKSLQRYTLSKEEILGAVAAAAAEGMDTIVLQSGESAIDARWLAEVIDAIASGYHLPVTLSVGEQPREACALWKEAGAQRFLLKHESADPEIYARLHPGYTLEERVNCLKMLQDLGYETGSGFIIGLPNQTLHTLAKDIVLARNLGVRMCGAGPFVPQAETPLAECPPGDAELTLRVMGVLRIALPWANLPATTALATVDPNRGQIDGLRLGGNVLMPSFTPPAYRESYRIYDNKNRVSAENARKAIHAAGRTCALPPTSSFGDQHVSGTDV